MIDIDNYKKALIADGFCNGQTIHSLSDKFQISPVDIEKILMAGMKAAHSILDMIHKAGILEEIIKASEG